MYCKKLGKKGKIFFYRQKGKNFQLAEKLTKNEAKGTKKWQNI